MKDIFLSLGSNLGDHRKNIFAAVEKLREKSKLIKFSSLYETEAWGKTDQPNFLNAAAWFKTELDPYDFLDEIHRIENELGRIRLEHWGSRTIDIDILHYENFSCNDDRLTLPHKFLKQRRFVLEPLSEIRPEFENLLRDCTDNLKVEKIFGSPNDFNFILLACVDENFGLGFENQLLFRIPKDMKKFRELTLNQRVIMGRKTFESIGKFLPDRENFVLSRHGLTIEKLFERLDNSKKNFIIGGSEIYEKFLPYVNRAEITLVHETRRSDVFLENLFEREDFLIESRQKFEDGFEFLTFIRK